jgi:hypothetical protein
MLGRVAPSPSAADTLLALLDHADGDTLLVLLDGKNLLTILRHAGRSEADVARALRAEKRNPGELLLELFREGRTSAELVGWLAPEEIERAKRESAEGRAAKAKPAGGFVGGLLAGREARKAAIHDARLWLVLVSVAGLAPAIVGLLDLNAAIRMLALGPGPVLSGIATLGLAAGAIGAKTPPGRLRGAVAGALTAVGMFVGVYLYMTQGPAAGRSTVLKLEIVIAAAVGALPGFAAYFLGRGPRAEG